VPSRSSSKGAAQEAMHVGRGVSTPCSSQGSVAAVAIVMYKRDYRTVVGRDMDAQITCMNAEARLHVIRQRGDVTLPRPPPSFLSST